MILQDLKTLIEIVLDETESEERVFEAINGMKDLYESHTGKTRESLKNMGIALQRGVAISPSQAAYCLVYTPMRSVVFLRGIYKAILHALSISPGECIRIFYAGCGPYAALLTPFTALFGADELAYYLLDINPESIEVAQKLYESLGAGAYVRKWLCDDATTCRLPADATMHVVISETMQKALSEEPQVAIMQNLIPQMAPDAVFIPEEINVRIKLLNQEDAARFNFFGDYVPECIDLGSLYTIGRHEYESPAPVTVQIPMNYGCFKTLALFTDIRVYGEEKLKAYASHLNTPVWVDEVDGKPGVKITFSYEMTATPGFRHKWEPYSFPSRQAPTKIFIGTP